MITAGVNEKAGGASTRNDPAGRLKLLESNVGIYRHIHRTCRDGCGQVSVVNLVG